MFSWQRVYAIVLRHLLQLVRDRNRMATVFYWPFIDILLIGYMAIYRYTVEGHDVLAAHILIANIILWQVVSRANFDVSLNLLEDIWAHNITNIFGSPLSILEWMISSTVFAIIMFFVMLIFYTILGYALFGFSLLSIGWVLALFLLGLLLGGLAIGFIASGFLIYSGNRITTFIFMATWIFAPITGVYYNIEVFPGVVQKIAYCFPFIYFFEALALHMKAGVFSFSMWFTGLCLAIFYCVLSVLFFIYMFEKSRRYGLARLVD